MMRRALEVKENLVLREGQPVGRLELAVELADEPGMGLEQAAPGGELEW
jgi:hypothetical protein